MTSEQSERILIVDDNPATLYATTRIVRQAGYEVVECATGREALKIVERDDCDLVVLDIELPDIDGHEVCRCIRLTPRVARIPVVHVSATFVSDFHKIKGLEAGADGYLTRPVEPLVLIATIRAFLRTRQMESALTRSEAKFRTIFDQALMGICLISNDMIYLDVNPAMCRIVGRDRDEIIGKHCSAFARAGQEAELIEISSKLNSQQQWLGSLPVLHRDGHIVELEWSISMHSTPRVFLALTSDVTEKRRIEAEREYLLQSERSARNAAERANRLKDEFLAMVSHELRTPLNAVVGWSQVLQMSPPSSEDLAVGLEAISRNAQVQAELINDLLDVSRIMSGKLRLDVKRINPVDIVHDALVSVLPAAQTKGVEIEHNLDQTFELIHADPSRLQQVVWNLVSNAVKFTPRSGKVSVLLKQNPAWLEIRVSDSGQGIKPEFLPHLFERFRQEDATSTRVHGGLGLGLSIVKQLVELHGGTVNATSSGEGRGSEFLVRLPQPQGQPLDTPDRHRQSAVGGAELTRLAPQVDLHEARVLIVDDDSDSRKLVARLLREVNASVAEADSVDRAIEALGTFQPQLLVSDIGMPHSDGYDLIRRVRGMGLEADQLPAIALTAFARPEDRERILGFGFQRHLGKPLEPAELLSAAVALLKSPSETP
jgi:PAS domain S-box-containing protein